MNQKHYKYIIIGGGLSGLSAALQFKLQGETDFIVLEAQNRVGGRVFTQSGIDLGATWIHNHHQTIQNLAQHLGLETFEQYTSGKSLYVAQPNKPAQAFEVSSNEPPSYRIKGGTGELIRRIYHQVEQNVWMKTEVLKLTEVDDLVRLSTNTTEYTASKVLLTVPLRLASTLDFVPALPQATMNEMRETHTWFSHAIKVGITFNAPFWRDAKRSGMLFDQGGAVIEIHDHSNKEENRFALMGFVNERLRGLTFQDQMQAILTYLELHFGKEIHSYTSFQLFDWSKEQFTSGEIGLPNLRKTQYGHALFQKAYFNGKLYFSGTESSIVQGGFMEGAVHRGLSLAQELLKK
jgi:monoamine oxidase